MTQTAVPSRRGTLIGAVIWALLVCVTAGLLAPPLGLPSLWGERVTVWTYMLPLPMSWGLMHVPGLFVGMIALVWSAHRGRGARAVVALLGLGMLAAAVLGAWDQRWSRFEWLPWSLYLGVDGAWLLLFAPVWGARRDAPAVPRWVSIAAFLLPVLPVASLQLQWGQRLHSYRVASSELDRAGQRMIFTVLLRNAPKDRAQACAALAKLAADPYPGQSQFADGEWMRLPREIRLYIGPIMPMSDARGEAVPVLRYRWQPDGTGVCEAGEPSSTTP